MVECIPLDSFNHDDWRAFRGVPLFVREELALQFERQGLVRVCKSRDEHPTPERAAGNPPAAGTQQPSSASPAAPLSPKRTVLSLKPGAREASYRKSMEKGTLKGG